MFPGKTGYDFSQELPSFNGLESCCGEESRSSFLSF